MCYLINCKRYSQQYTEETKFEFHLIMNNHNGDVGTNKSTRIIRHFSNYRVTNIQPTISERVASSDPFICKARQRFYIELLGTGNKCTIIFSFLHSFIQFTSITGVVFITESQNLVFHDLPIVHYYCII